MPGRILVHTLLTNTYSNNVSDVAVMTEIPPETKPMDARVGPGHLLQGLAHRLGRPLLAAAGVATAQPGSSPRAVDISARSRSRRARASRRVWVSGVEESGGWRVSR